MQPGGGAESCQEADSFGETGAPRAYLVASSLEMTGLVLTKLRNVRWQKR